MAINKQLLLISIVTVITLAASLVERGRFIDLWLTHDQQGRRAFDSREFQVAFELFQNPGWRGTAAYSAGLYSEAATSFARNDNATGYYNRGNALMKDRNFAQAITAYTHAVKLAPEWAEAKNNLELAAYTRSYIESAREQSDTGDESELSADGYKFDKDSDRGKEIVITRDSTIQLESAQKWMRAVNTDTRDFLKTRFMMQFIQQNNANGQQQ